MIDIEKPGVFIPPTDPKSKIWRYMDFTKFVSLLENKGLFFTRLDCLDDPFEGSHSRGNENLKQTKYSDTVKAAVADFTVTSTRKRIMVNCWHLNEDESAAMWKLYSKTNEAICVQSTYERLRECLDQEIGIGRVRYIDYRSDWMPEHHLFYAAMHKRRSFAHEQELRALVYDKSELVPDFGLWISVDLHRLIEKVYVAPTSPAWIRELVEKIVTRYKLNKPVEQSSLDEPPFF